MTKNDAVQSDFLERQGDAAVVECASDGTLATVGPNGYLTVISARQDMT